MSHIVIDGRMIGWTGIGRYTQCLLENLEVIDRKNEYTVLMLPKDMTKWRPSAKNFHVHIADIPPYSYSEQIKLPLVLANLKPDLVHFPSPNTPLIYFGKRICTIHDLTLIDYKNVRGGNTLRYEVRFRAFRMVVVNAAKHSTRVLTHTKYIADYISKRLRAKRSLVTAIPLASERMAAKPMPYASMKNKKYILYVGNAYPYKNLERLCDAFVKLGQPDLHLILVGKQDYFYDALQKYTAHRKYSHIHQTGFVSDEQLVWLYQNAALYAFPSLSEGFGLPGLEAMQYGVPVVSANATCLPEVYGDAAAYFDPLDTEDMARVMGEVLESKKLQGQLRKKGFARVKQFSWRKTAEQTLAVYEEALQEGQ